MSIINDALKKTGEYLQKNSTANTAFPAIPPKVKPLFFYILILLVGLLLGNLIFNFISHKINNQVTPKKNIPIATEAVKPPLPPIQPAQTQEEKKPAEKTPFILNGIFYSDNNGYALINNQIVRENDYVDGAKVSLITTDKVELDNAGQIITLTTHR
ncbi:MAG: hypothetical protein NT014_00210 [Candidatus Omnitrophica bacterium]|nr:hypothetical protein [Candidatus Omnitrophota bacterium]